MVSSFRVMDKSRAGMVALLWMLLYFDKLPTMITLPNIDMCGKTVAEKSPPTLSQKISTPKNIKVVSITYKLKTRTTRLVRNAGFSCSRNT